MASLVSRSSARIRATTFRGPISYQATMLYPFTTISPLSLMPR
jgi:hypothetical protein